MAAVRRTVTLKWPPASRARIYYRERRGGGEFLTRRGSVKGIRNGFHGHEADIVGGWLVFRKIHHAGEDALSESGEIVRESVTHDLFEPLAAKILPTRIHGL